MLRTSCLVAITLIGIVQAGHIELGSHHSWGDTRNHEEENFQGYPTNHPPLTPLPDITTSSPDTASDVGHRTILKGAFQKVLGPDFSSPGLKDLAFLSSGFPSVSETPHDSDSSAQGAHTAPIRRAQGAHLDYNSYYDVPGHTQPPPESNGDSYSSYGIEYIP